MLSQSKSIKNKKIKLSLYPPTSWFILLSNSAIRLQLLASLLICSLIYKLYNSLKGSQVTFTFLRPLKYVIKRQCASFYPDGEGPAFGLGVWWAGSLEAIFILPFLDKIIFHPSMWREAEAGENFDGVRDGGKWAPRCIWGWHVSLPLFVLTSRSGCIVVYTHDINIRYLSNSHQANLRMLAMG